MVPNELLHDSDIEMVYDNDVDEIPPKRLCSTDARKKYEDEEHSSNNSIIESHTVDEDVVYMHQQNHNISDTLNQSKGVPLADFRITTKPIPPSALAIIKKKGYITINEFEVENKSITPALQQTHLT